MLVYKFDENFTYTQPAFYKHGLENFTEIAPPDGLFQAKWNPQTQEWTEGATQEFIDNLLNSNDVNTNEVKELQRAIADLTIQLVQNGVI